MYMLELHKLNAIELRRRAEQERLAGEARRARRAVRRAARESVRKEAEGPVSTDRDRFVHAA
ncbi:MULTISPECIES: hypothetical protein [Streptomyces]|uniref:hypothetical protein n=1 Tax=Streptomyces TaxID=1883 RepID=UPI00166F6D1B|nr:MULTISPECIES: hypothetical protein [Streptomyces]MEE1808648.1 hypothetical protein [Streptomyces sp. BE133]WPW31583.1 hypothetical protein P6B95_32125 [Streptomyces atratus]GGT40399.1 hypothetical protein GCM10010207_45710 [Streptomyces atratus]